MRADMHMHSIYSDGTFTPEEIVIEAMEQKLDIIALTDHNTFDGIPEFLEAAGRRGIKAVAGTELTTEFEGSEIHLLAYFPDFTEDSVAPLVSRLKEYHTKKAEQNRAIVENLSKDFPQVSYEGFMEFSKERGYRNMNRMHIGRYLLHLGVTDPSEGPMTGILSRKQKYYVGMERPDLVETAKTVCACGGIPVVAHMVQYRKFDLEGRRRILDTLDKAVPRFGAELFHNDHGKEFIRECRELCLSVNEDIVFTAGSDFHGTNKINRVGFPYTFEMDEEFSDLYDKVSSDICRLMG